MRALSEFILDAVAEQLFNAEVPEYRNTFAIVEKDVRASSVTDLADGPIVFVCYAGEQAQSSGNGMQVNLLELSIEAHTKADEERQKIGMGMISDIKKALLSDKSYLKGIARVEGVTVTSANIQASDQDDTIIASVAIQIPYLERHGQIYFDE